MPMSYHINSSPLFSMMYIIMMEFIIFSYRLSLFKMKVIKHLKRETHEQKIKRFFQEMPFLTKIVIASTIAISVVLLFARSIDSYSIASLFQMRSTEIILFLVMGISEFKRQQGKGSIFFAITLLIKSGLILTCQAILAHFVIGWPKFQILDSTSIPIQYLLIIGLQDALENPQQKKYLFSQPFQIKCKFYPLFIIIFLLIAKLRVDVLLTIVVSIILHFSRFNKLITLLSSKLDGPLLSQKMLELGFLKTGSNLRVLKPLDELATNDSIVLQEK